MGIWQRGGLIPIHPMVARRDWAERLATLTKDLGDLLISRSLARAAGDLGAVATAAGLRADESWKYQSGRPLQDALGMYRADVVVSSGVPRFLEFNFGTCLNGIASTSLLQQTFLSGISVLPETTVQGRQPPTVLDARAAWAKRSLKPGQRCGVVGFAAEGDEGSLRVFDADVQALRKAGVPSDFVPAKNAVITDAGLEHEGRVYHGVLRYFLLGSRYETARPGFAEALESAPNVRLLGASSYEIFTSKLLLADLCCDQGLSRAERDLVSHIPWTARAIDTRVPRRGSRVEPLVWAEQNRELAVLKPGRGAGSRGVLIGAFTPENAWRQALDRAANEGDWVIQEQVPGDRMPVAYLDSNSDDVRTVDQPALLGPFVVDGAYAGCYTRHTTAEAADGFLRADRKEFSNCLLAV
ncbi:MAG: hypothetical protein CSA63_01630 [Propionibacterium sp.]|nr:MAG: hypothetical protein CSA63_01630 [Propionibacterium sp.]